VVDVDDDPAAEPEDPEARLPPQPEPERDDPLEVAGVLELPEIRAQRRPDLRQQVRPSLGVPACVPDHDEEPLAPPQRHRTTGAVLEDPLHVAHDVARTAEARAHHQPVEAGVAPGGHAEHLGLPTASG
jgi:hypothetical protein